MPGDPHFGEQWALTKINAPSAWDETTGSGSIVIAVIDSGVDTSHADLAGQLWTNPDEIPGNQIDDDNNGRVDDIHGWNILDNDGNLDDTTGHGTQVAGVIGATANNGAGGAGVCWGCKLMIVKVVKAGGVANYSDIAAGVLYAAQKGAKVINLSLGGAQDSATLRAAIAEAAKTAVIVGGAGNDNSGARFYPAAYDDAVLAVAGVDQNDVKVDTSNYGAWVDVSAPGKDILTTFSGGGYGSASGTSLAAPFAAGLAGLLLSQHPAWSPDQMRAQMIRTTTSIESTNPALHGQLGSGRIDAGRALTTPAQPALALASYAANGQPGGRPEPGSTVEMVVTLTNGWADATDVQATLSSGRVAITQPTASFGSIAAFKSGTSTTASRFTAASGYNTPMDFMQCRRSLR